MSIFTWELQSQLKNIARYLEEDIKQILIDDGHSNTGALVKSISNAVISGTDSISIEGSMLIYGGAVIKGRQPGTKRIPVDALIRYLEEKNFSDDAKRTRGVAFHIQQRIFEQGIKPDDFIEKAFNKNEMTITRDLMNATERALDLSLSNLINNAKQFA